MRSDQQSVRFAGTLRWMVPCLVALMVFQGAIFWKLGWLEPRLTNDTAGYRDFDWSGLTTALSSMRTPGYPLVLKLCQPFGDQAVPILQFTAYCLGVLIFFRGLSRLTGDPLRSGLAASVLLGARILPGYVNELATDALAAAIGIAAVGQLLMYLVTGRTSVLVSVAVLVSCAWLIRPVFLFLIVAIPALAWTLRQHMPSDIAVHRRTIWRVVLAVTIPLLSWCLLRAGVTGRFGVVSFGGYNLIGIAGQFLSEDDIPRLSPELQVPAREALNRRDSGQLPNGKWDNLPASNYLRMEDRYDITIWHMFAPVNQSSEIQVPGRNTQLRQLAQELILLHPADYANWLVKAVRQSFRKTLWDLADSLFGTMLLIVFIGTLMIRSLRRQSQTIGQGTKNSLPEFSAVTRIVLLISVMWWFLNLCVVIPVCPPLGRFTDSASVFLLCPFATSLCDLIIAQSRTPAESCPR